ncbi:MAG: hypothetical protein JNM14_11190 [Ferruginibacter sp.]|nr:hypothetical protein [Ferruginibacter sp.]
MAANIDVRKFIPFFLISICIATTPHLFFWYLVALAICVKAFVVICVVDFFRKTSLRKNFGLVLSVMILAAICSLVVLSLKYSVIPVSF